MDDAKFDRMACDMSNIALSMARLETLMCQTTKHLEDTRVQLSCINEKQVELRVAVGKLEVKNGLIATILGGVSGLIGTKLG